jgi:hypothetical protein
LAFSICVFAKNRKNVKKPIIFFEKRRLCTKKCTLALLYCNHQGGGQIGLAEEKEIAK